MTREKLLTLTRRWIYSTVSIPSDVVICDIQMPGHDGLWLVARVRERFPNVAIVLATGVETCRRGRACAVELWNTC